MSIMVLPIKCGLEIAGNRVTDHNRTAVVITETRIENRKRMANGTMRSFFIAQKRKIKTSWDNLPYQDIRTADGFWGAHSLINFYNANAGEFSIRLNKGDGTYEDILVFFDDFAPQLKNRGAYTDLYSIDITFEEV